MAQFKYAFYLGRTTGGRFDHISPPGAAAPHLGIYRCEGCGREVVAFRAEALPEASDHQHTWAQGTIRWRLAVAAQ